MTKQNILAARRAASQAAFLEAGVNALQSPFSRADDVKAKDLAPAIGKTTGSFFNIWQTQDQYKQDLARHVMAAENDIDYAAVTASTQLYLSKNRPAAWAEKNLALIEDSKMFLPGRAFRSEEFARTVYADSVPAYLERQHSLITTSISESMGYDIDVDTADLVVVTSEDLLIHSMRGDITSAAAATALARLIS